MPDYSVLPSTLNLSFIRGDEFGCLLDFDQDLTGYTFSAVIYPVASVRAGVVTAGTAFLNFTLTNVDLSAGKVNLRKPHRSAVFTTHIGLSVWSVWANSGLVVAPTTIAPARRSASVT